MQLDGNLRRLFNSSSSSSSSAPPLPVPPPPSTSYHPPDPHPHPRPRHNQFLPYPPPAPPDQDLRFFNHPADMHPPLPYSDPSLTASSEIDSSDAKLMAFLSLDINSFDFSPSPVFGSGAHHDSGICRGGASNVSHGGGSGNGNVMVGLPSSLVTRGWHLVGDEVYDIDARMNGEVVQPLLEVRPITKYVLDPWLMLGRQIAVNSSYICYGLKMGNIRVLNINTTLGSLLRGHTQVAFFGSCPEIVRDILFSLVLCILLEDVSCSGKS